MYHSIKDIFLNKLILLEVEQIHRALYSSYSSLDTLREHLATGSYWDKDKIDTIKKSGTLADIQEYMRKGESGEFNKFGVFNLVECRYMWGRSEFIINLDKKFPDLLDSHSPPLNKIEEASLLGALYPSLMFPIKTFLITKGRQDDYKGILPFTSPVKKTTITLFGLSQNQYENTLLCRDIAKELNTSPFYVNTALWYLGDKLNKQEN